MATDFKRLGQRAAREARQERAGQSPAFRQDPAQIEIENRRFIRENRPELLGGPPALRPDPGGRPAPTPIQAQDPNIGTRFLNQLEIDTGIKIPPQLAADAVLTLPQLLPSGGFLLRPLLEGATAVGTERLFGEPVREAFNLPATRLPDEAAFTSGAISGLASRTMEIPSNFFRNTLRTRPIARELMREGQFLGVSPTPSMLAQGGAIASFSRGAQQTATGQVIIGRSLTKMFEGLNTARDKFLSRFGPATKTPMDAAGEITDLIESRTGFDALTDEAGLLTVEVNRRWGDFRDSAARIGLNVRPTETLRTIQRFAEGKTPSGETRLKSAVGGKIRRLAKELQKGISDANGQVSVSQFDVWRQGIGPLTKKPATSVEAKEIWAAMMRDLERTSKGTPVEGLHKQARAISRFQDEVFKDSQTLRGLNADPEKALDILGSSPSQITRTKNAILGLDETGKPLRRGLLAGKISDDDRGKWNLFRRHILEGVFRRAKNEAERGAAIDATIDGVKLQNIIDTKLGGEEGLRALFSDPFTKPREVAEMVRTMQSLARISREVQFAQQSASASFSPMSAFGVMLAGGTAAGAGLGRMAGSSKVGAVLGSVASFLGVPRMMAAIATSKTLGKLMADDRFIFKNVRRFTRGADKITQSMLRYTAQVGLKIIAESEAESAERRGEPLSDSEALDRMTEELANAYRFVIEQIPAGSQEAIQKVRESFDAFDIPIPRLPLGQLPQLSSDQDKILGDREKVRQKFEGPFREFFDSDPTQTPEFRARVEQELRSTGRLSDETIGALEQSDGALDEFFRRRQQRSAGGTRQ